MFKIFPAIRTILTINITHKENQFLVVSMRSSEEFFAENLLIIYDEILEILKIKCYYISHYWDHHYFIYKYGAYDEGILEKFLEEKKELLKMNNQNILEESSGFFYIDPFTHELSIDNLNPPEVPVICGGIGFYDSIIKLKHMYTDKKMDILVEVFYPPVDSWEKVVVKIPKEMYKYMDVLSQQTFMYIYIKDGDFFVQFTLKYKYQRVLRYKNKEFIYPKIFSYYLKKPIVHSYEQIWKTLWQITRNSILYHNRRDLLKITIVGVPENLSLKNYIQYENKYYKIIKIKITTPPIRCYIWGVRSTLDLLPLIQEDIPFQQEKDLLWEDIFYISANNQLFLKKKFHKTYYIDHIYDTLNL